MLILRWLSGQTFATSGAETRAASYREGWHNCKEKARLGRREWRTMGVK
jgi:hypothetical protein